MKTVLAAAFAILLVAGQLTAAVQETVEPDIQKRLGLIRDGKSDQVRSELPSLMARYPNDPGLLYLQGVLTVDGGEAVRIFQNIADNFPKSEWADDALYKTYQYYYALGLYQTADQKLERLKRDYPGSPYLRSLQQQAAMQPALPSVTTPERPAAKPESKPQVVETRPARTEPETTPAIVSTSPAKTGTYTIQTGVFSSRQNAEKFQVALNQAGFQAEIRTRMVNGREMYRVCIGSYPTTEEAQRQVEVLKGKNITGIVTGW